MGNKHCEASGKCQGCPAAEVQKVAEIVPTNTVICNYAMVIHVVDTAIAPTTVMDSLMGSWTVALTTGADEAVTLRINNLFVR